MKPIGEPLPRNVNFLAADVMRIDPEKKIVETSITTLRYDFLVSALGCRVAPEEIRKGFYRSLLALQGHRNTYYLGAAVDTNESRSVWIHAEHMIKTVFG